MSVTVRDPPDLAHELKRVETDICRFSRGYCVGYAQCLGIKRVPGEMRLPEQYLGDVVAALRGTGANFKIRVFEVEPPRAETHGIRFVRVRVTFPQGNEVWPAEFERWGSGITAARIPGATLLQVA